MLLFALLELIDSEEDKIRFEEFYYKYHDLVMFICLKRINDFHLAEDACQEAFMAIARNFGKIKEIDSKETKGYVYVVANGFAINKFNKEIARNHNFALNDNNVKIIDKSFDLYSATELSLAIEELSDEDKTYLRLKYLYGYTLKEIAKMFDESVSNVNKKVHKATNRLKERLGDSNE